MRRQQEVEERSTRSKGDLARERLLAAMPVSERRVTLADVSTPVLEAGQGHPVVLLHSAGEFAATWMRVIPSLARTHRVVAPDLPGHGASEVTTGPLNADRVFRWLGELIQRTCPSPPTIVGHLLGGAIAARFAGKHEDRVSRLVLVDSYGLSRLWPAPSFTLALMAFVARPTERTQDRLFRQCMVDLDRVLEEMGELGTSLDTYALDRARTPSVKAALNQLMREFGVPGISSSELSRITVPTTLIWGRHDRQVRLRIAEAASDRYGWPLHVIDDAADDPAIEQPTAFLRALHTALDGSKAEGN